MPKMHWSEKHLEAKITAGNLNGLKRPENGRGSYPAVKVPDRRRMTRYNRPRASDEHRCNAPTSHVMVSPMAIIAEMYYPHARHARRRLRRSPTATTAQSKYHERF
jgi:hypothetical protein